MQKERNKKDSIERKDIRLWTPYIVPLVSMCSHPPPHMVPWHVPNDILKCVSICSSCGFFNFFQYCLPHTHIVVSPSVVPLVPHVFPLPHMVQWHAPNDVPQQCVSICSSYNFLNFSNILYHLFLTPNVVPLVPMCSHPHTWFNDMFPMMFPNVLQFVLHVVSKISPIFFTTYF